MSRRRRGLPLLLLGLALAGGVGFFVSHLTADQPGTRLGAEEVVFDWSKDACDPSDIPDLPARAFRDSRGQVQLLLSHFVNRRMIGPALGRLSHPCSVVMASDDDPRPSRFDDRKWIASVYTDNGERILALVHEEYQGNLHAGRCPSEIYLRCWYNALTLAVSNDGGRRFEHVAPPPRDLVAAIPHRYVADAGPAGIFSPSNIVRRTSDGYFYVLARLRAYGRERGGTCVLRTRNLADPRSWRAWGGRKFDVEFVDPYREHAHGTARNCTPVAPRQIQDMDESLSYSTFFRRFLLVGVAVRREDGRPRAGIYFSLSDDLIEWTPRRLIKEIETPATYSCGDADPIAYPSVIDPNSSSRTFSTTGRTAYLYFTRFHYRACRRTLDRDLMRVPIDFSK